MYIERGVFVTRVCRCEFTQIGRRRRYDTPWTGQTDTRDERTARESVQPRKASRSRERERESEETASVVFKTFEGRWVKK